MTEHTDIFKEINRNISEGNPFVIVTIVHTAGSSPRQAGARMLVYPDGSIYSTIGGGKFEKLVIDDCVGMFGANQATRFKKYGFPGEGSDSTGMNCGGEAEVFMEKFGKPNRLVIFGGGHVGKDLVNIVKELDFSITVVDDRKDILSGYNTDITTVLTDDHYLNDFPVLDENCYVVIVTRSHNCDRNVLEKVLSHKCAYVGMIGSKKKVAKIFESLKENGVNAQRISKVHAPVGLDIGAEGPYEIAVSIVAELIAAMKGKLAKF